MDRIREVIENIQELDTNQLFLDVADLLPTRSFIIDLVKIKQLYEKGIDENEEVIGYYSVATSLLDKSKKVGTPYTLLDSGDFYESIQIEIQKQGIEIVADTLKEDGTDLEEKYGDGILGLTEKNLQKLINYVAENIHEMVLQEILSDR